MESNPESSAYRRTSNLLACNAPQGLTVQTQIFYQCPWCKGEGRKLTRTQSERWLNALTKLTDLAMLLSSGACLYLTRTFKIFGVLHAFDSTGPRVYEEK